MAVVYFKNLAQAKTQVSIYGMTDTLRVKRGGSIVNVKQGTERESGRREGHERLTRHARMA